MLSSHHLLVFTVPVISEAFLTMSIVARQDSIASPIFPTTKDVADDTPPPSSQDSDADFEAKSYYYGLPSNPISVYHTGAPWKRPTGPEAQRVPKEARPICNHLITDVWDQLGPQVPQYLDSVNIKWTTIDITHFAEVKKDASPIFLWVGVKPRSLSCENTEVVARVFKSS